MARLVDIYPSSDDDLPDLKTLIRKPSTRAIKTTTPAPSVSKPTISKTTSNSETRRVRRLGEPTQAAANPLFQKWNSGEQESTRTGRGNNSGSETEEDIPQSRQQPRRRRNQRVVKDSDDESHEDYESEKERDLTRVRRLQKTKTSAVTMPALDIKNPIPSIRTGTKSKALLFAREIDRDAESEESQEEDEAEEPSIYQTADEHSDSASELDWLNDSSEFPTRKGARSPSSQPPKTIGTRGHISSIKNAPTLQPKPSANICNGKTRDVAKNTASSKEAVGPRKTSQRGKRHASGTTTASDLADTLSKLRLQLEDFSDEESKVSKIEEFTTPPSTPPKASKPRGLASPSKKIQIPKTPHRPSMDAFWNQDFVNDWNDQHSPRKLILPPVTKSPSKTSPKKEPKKETKKSFGSRKHALAESFLAELDREITQGRIAKLAESTGGVKLVWTKTLNTTAGRASWRCETIRTTRQADDGQPIKIYRHHASIELAEKVIDDENRLLNVMAHEFCHLANFMISGITTNPHGREFKVWAAKCSAKFGDRGIEVTTKHSYEIDFKYVWECEECGVEYKRHSKSIDTRRYKCGKCKGSLKQTRPAPRGAAAGKAPSRYQAFVKEQMAVVRGENPGSPQKVVMKLIAEKWAKQEGGKAGSKVASKLGVDSVVDKMVDLTIEAEA
ncbi:SprT-like family-domain-containing protein [Fusarium redolens]|uniref:SprT-like family-domain-containing protein n=1 Tax=Fusarium redolens TaxID=48865 RepID=A0A9P9KI74_FUSRE|nr:SprT-like family-domain-containing protein [Fusarium redolens]KAH7253469.1 SprT-like family-domain-containing protein [Fusarium redolens]